MVTEREIEETMQLVPEIREEVKMEDREVARGRVRPAFHFQPANLRAAHDDLVDAQTYAHEAMARGDMNVRATMRAEEPVEDYAEVPRHEFRVETYDTAAMEPATMTPMPEPQGSPTFPWLERILGHWICGKFMTPAEIQEEYASPTIGRGTVAGGTRAVYADPGDYNPFEDAGDVMPTPGDGG